MSKILVKATPGGKCPREENPRTYITDDPKGVEITVSTFYRRLINEGSLVIVDGAKKKATGGES